MKAPHTKFLMGAVPVIQGEGLISRSRPAWAWTVGGGGGSGQVKRCGLPTTGTPHQPRGLRLLAPDAKFTAADRRGARDVPLGDSEPEAATHSPRHL